MTNHELSIVQIVSDTKFVGHYEIIGLAILNRSIYKQLLITVINPEIFMMNKTSY